MERKIGEVFDFKGVKLQVKDTGCKFFAMAVISMGTSVMALMKIFEIV